MSDIRDNWARLVEAVLLREKLRRIALQDSRSPSVSSISSSFSFGSSFRLDEIYWRSEADGFIEKAFGRLVSIGSQHFAVGLEDVLGPSSKFIGRGTFGSAYNVGMNDGVVAVVKRLRGVTVPGRVFEEQMKAIGSIRHENVAPLRAYYFSVHEKLMVYDYFAQQSVHTMLHGRSREDTSPLDWETKLRIAIGAARGIAHIHAKFGEKIVHGNIKASNVFLNSQGYGCISDFGLPYMMRASVVKRTAGNYAPEVESSHQMSQESDVYSFGVLLLEVLTRKSHRYSTDGSRFNLIQWVRSVVSKEQPVVISEEELIKYPNVEMEMVKMLRIGMRCLDRVPEHRPNMPQVVNLLEDIQRANIPVAVVPNAAEGRVGEITALSYNEPQEKTRNRGISIENKVSTKHHAAHQNFEGLVRQGFVNEIEK